MMTHSPATERGLKILGSFRFDCAPLSIWLHAFGTWPNAPEGEISGWRSRCPERRAFGEAFPGDQKFLPQGRQTLQVIGCCAFPKYGQAKAGSKLRDWPDAILACRIKKHPPPHVLFRPEEIHLASGTCYIFAPTPVGNVRVTNHARRVNGE